MKIPGKFPKWDFGGSIFGILGYPILGFNHNLFLGISEGGRALGDQVTECQSIWVAS